MLRRITLLSSLALPLACASPPRDERPASPPPTPANLPAPPPTTATPEPAAPAPTRLVPPVSELLRDGFAQRFEQRTMPKRARDPRREPVVVSHEPDRTRYIIDLPDYRVLITAKDADLWESPVSVTALTQWPTAPKKEGERVLVGPSLHVERQQEKNGFVQVTAHDLTMQVEGWLDPKLLGRVYVPTPVPMLEGGERWILAPESKLLDAPGGRVIARVLEAPHRRVVVFVMKRTAAWYKEVVYQTPALSVRGFVPKSALSEPDQRDWAVGFGGLGHGLTPPTEKLTFGTGTCLYAEPWGEVVGILRRPRTASVHIESGERAPWRKIYVADSASVWLPRAGATKWLPSDSATKTPPDKSPKPLSLASGFTCAPPPKR